MLTELSGTITSQFQFFWYKDCFPDGYYFFHWRSQLRAVKPFLGGNLEILIFT